MRELQILLQRLGFIVSGGNTIGMYDFFVQWGERDTAYLSRSSRLAAPGWEAVDIVFGDDANIYRPHLSGGLGLKLMMNDNFVLSADWAVRKACVDNDFAETAEVERSVWRCYT